MKANKAAHVQLHLDTPPSHCAESSPPSPLGISDPEVHPCLGSCPSHLGRHLFCKSS